MKKILITGGHLSPAVALIEEIQVGKKPYTLVFAGRKYAFEDDTSVSQEYKTITALNLRFYSIVTGRLQRSFTWQSLLSLVKFPFGIVQSLWICITERPNVIMSFGGYIALPVVISGWMLRIPIITHEQTTILGLANKIIVTFANVVCVTFPDMKKVNHARVVVTGLPIRKEIMKPVDSASFVVSHTRPILYITGGTTGAEKVNEVVFSVLPQLLKKYTVVHQTGQRSFETAGKTALTLPSESASHYVFRSYFSPEDVGWILKHSNFVLSRSGANSVAEFMATGCPAILVPLPWSGGNEQLHNAERLVGVGMGVILPQQALTPEALIKCIEDFSVRLSEYKLQAQKAKETVFLDGTRLVLAQIERILS